MNKTEKSFINLKTVVLEKYHHFLNMFLKKKFNIVAGHSKYNHKIQLLENYKNLGHSLLYGILQE